MKWDELINHDSSLSLQRPKNWEADIVGIADCEDPRPNHLVFVKNGKFLNKIHSSKNTPQVGLVLQESFFNKSQEDEPVKEMLKNVAFVATTKSVDVSLSYLSKAFYQNLENDKNFFVDGRQTGKAEIHPTAKVAQGVFIGEGVTIAEDVVILPGCVLMGNNKIDRGTKLFPNVTLYPNVHIGEEVRIHAGAVIGSDGYGYNFDQGAHQKVWHIGGVRIGNSVEIGSQSNIDGGTFSPTTIGHGTKIDSQVQIGHNCWIGEHVIICGQVGVAGSCVLENYCVLGGKAGVGPGVTLGEGSQVAGSAQVNSDHPKGSVLGGHPARPVKEWLRGLAYLRKVSLRN